MSGARFARVALPLPVAEPYRYAVPATFADRVRPGMRVVVPVRHQEMVGIVTGLDDTPPPGTARELLAVPDDTPALSAPLLALADEAARHVGAPPGLMLRAMLPGPLWGRTTVHLVLTEAGRAAHVGGTAGDLLQWLQRRTGAATVRSSTRVLKRPTWEVADRLRRLGFLSLETVPVDVRGGAKTDRVATLTGEPLTLRERDQRFARAPAQRALYEALELAGGRQSVAALLARANVSAGPLTRLAADGLVRLDQVESIRDPFADLPVVAPPTTLLPDQQAALTRLAAMPPGGEALLFGVTGSGKTAVYLERVRHVLEVGGGAILLVPEIALTPQTVARVRGAFGDQVAVLHSGLSDNERADAWRQLHQGDRMVAVGARSAIFAPVQRLGIIVLDEEHETTYKNGETPRYHARDIARMRGALEGATVVLGSATPSVETWARAEAGTVVRIDLPTRVAARPMPPVELIDLRHEPLVHVGAVPWTERLDDAVARTLARGEQVLLLLNRRGWATFIQCASCGEVVECPACSIALTLHHGPEHLRCHYCNHSTSVPARCPSCRGETIAHRGAGTQQLERLVAERFPTARLARMDVDTTGARWAHHRILGRVGAGEVDILLGTQMIAKGIDFPNVTLVGVVDADTALHLPDFRSSERTFQLIAQVAGRAGRGPKGGRVLVQTRQPEHPALQFAAQHDAAGFLAMELANREVPPYPPTLALARVIASGPDVEEVSRGITAFREWSEAAIARSEAGLVVLGPAPCPIERIRGEHRMHLLVRGDVHALGAWVRTVGPRLGARRGTVRFTLDRDPVSLL
ncbi:MAG TPA: primosomal protein N' [Gemmatimonadales bacterium]|nr:primosomal protein N' [Gemmatimonadales bacterium]